MGDKLEQRIAIKFCCRLKISATETFYLLHEAFGNETMSRASAFRWHKLFQQGRETAEDGQRFGRPITVRNKMMIDTVGVIIRDDPRIVIHDIAGQLNISYGSAQAILNEDLGLHHMCCRWVPKLLETEHMEHRVRICQELQNRVEIEGNNFLHSVVMVDETWVYYTNPESKTKSQQCKSQPSKKAKVLKDAKVLVFSFFDHEGFIYQHSVPSYTTVSDQYYVTVLRFMLEHYQINRPNKNKDVLLLYHDITRSHVTEEVEKFLKDNEIRVLPHPVYSPDLVPCDFWLYSSLRKEIKSRNYRSRDEVTESFDAICKHLSVNGLDFVFARWQKRWQQCILKQGGYFDKDHVD